MLTFDQIFLLGEWIGTAAFAISGAMVAIDKRTDVFGVLLLAVFTALGGGTVRDILIGHFPPRMFSNGQYVLLAIFCALIVFIVARIMRERYIAMEGEIERINVVFDAIGLGVFAVSGASIGMEAGYGDNLGLRLGIGLGLHLYRFFLGNNVCPKFSNGFAQSICIHFRQFPESMHLQPQKEGFPGEQIQILFLAGKKGFLKILKTGIKGFPFPVRPGFSQGFSQFCQQSCIVTGGAELNFVHPGNLVEFQKFVIGFHFRTAISCRHHPFDHTGNTGSAKPAQNAETLIAFLDIEFA
ncbi:MAG: TRIC cation channel family protein [Clostridia bacterium]|nr:TRIC cation channel family protein [Clostridia bacterium]